MMTDTALMVRQAGALDSAASRRELLEVVIQNWAIGTTDGDSPRRYDLMRIKTRALEEFFGSVGWVSPLAVTPDNVADWQQQLEARGLSASTVYAMTSRLSSFYKWLGQMPAFKGRITNPVDAARPKAPKAYQSEDVQALSAYAVKRLIAVVKEKADSGSLVGKRDYAMLLWYLLTGRRREEVARLRWGDIEWGSRVIVSYRVKGGKRERREMNHSAPIDALLHYLEASGRRAGMEKDSPLWTSHDNHNANPGAALTSRAFVKNLKRYARQAGIGDVHLHQTRHTAAQLIADRDGIKAAQELLGHSKEETTRVYVKRITVQRDRYSDQLADEFGLED